MCFVCSARTFGRITRIDPRDPTDESEEHELVELLIVAGVLAREQPNEIDLTPDFQDAWYERIRTTRGRELGVADVRAMYDADTITSHGPTSFVVDKNKSVRWESERLSVRTLLPQPSLESGLTGGARCPNRTVIEYSLDPPN